MKIWFLALAGLGCAALEVDAKDVAESGVTVTPFTYPVFYRNQENAAFYGRAHFPRRVGFFASVEVGGRKGKRMYFLSEGKSWNEWVDIIVPLPDPALFQPGDYDYVFRLTNSEGQPHFTREGTLTIRPRLERDCLKVVSWGGFKPISHDFLELIGVNTVNYIHPDGPGRERQELDALKRGMMLSVRDTDYKQYLPMNLDAERIRTRFRDNWFGLRGVHGWTLSLLNSEVLGSKTFPVWKCASNDVWRAIAEDAICTKLPPMSAYVNEPHQVNWPKLGKKSPHGIIPDQMPELDLLLWLHRDGCPVLIGNDYHTEVIRELSPGNMTWSEPVIETTGIARHNDMVADWMYDYETYVNIRNLQDQFAWVRGYGKRYMPTLSPGYYHVRRRGMWASHPTLKDAKGKPVEYMLTQSAEEMIIRAWLCFGAVAAHDLSLFALDTWEYGMQTAEELKAAKWSCTNNTSVCEKDDPARFGKLLRETFLPAAELLRDMPNVRAPVAVCQPLENRPATRGWNVYLRNWEWQDSLSKALPATPFDVISDPEFNLNTLSKYRYVFLPYAHVITESHAKVLDAVSRTSTLVFDEECREGLFPKAVRIKAEELDGWYAKIVKELHNSLEARSDEDGWERAFTFLKEYEGAKYAVVVNDRRERGDVLQCAYQTNAWYKPVAVAQSITTRLKVPADAAIYDFAQGGKRLNPRVENGEAVITLDYAPGEGRVFAIYPSALKTLRLKVGGQLVAGRKGVLEVEVLDEKGRPAVGRQLISVSVCGPDGTERDESGRYTVEKGRIVIPVRFATAEVSGGRWTVRVRELTTGLSSEKDFRLSGKTSGTR